MGAVQTSPEEINRLNLNELGDFYEVPWLTDWRTVPMKACGCLRSSLTDMVKYTQAALQAARAMPAECRSDASTDPPDAAGCLASESIGMRDAGEGGLPADVLRTLGYAQQRQRVRGSRMPFQCDVMQAVEGIGAPQALRQLSAGTRGNDGSQGPMSVLKRRASQILVGMKSISVLLLPDSTPWFNRTSY